MIPQSACNSMLCPRLFDHPVPLLFSSFFCAQLQKDPSQQVALLVTATIPLTAGKLLARRLRDAASEFWEYAWIQSPPTSKWFFANCFWLKCQWSCRPFHFSGPELSIYPRRAWHTKHRLSTMKSMSCNNDGLWGAFRTKENADWDNRLLNLIWAPLWQVTAGINMHFSKE